jgi:hypothetical protein
MIGFLLRDFPDYGSYGSGGEPDFVKALRDLFDLDVEETMVDLVGSEAVGLWPHALPPPTDSVIGGRG